MKSIISRFHYITQEIPGHNLLHDIEAACQGGVKWVQLRLKNKSQNEIIAFAKEVKIVCRKYSAVFIVNDYVNVTIEVDADGVHLGKDDMDIIEAKKLLGKNKIIGASTNSFDDIQRVNELDIDYVGLGPFRYTTTKENLNSILGADGVKAILAKINRANIVIPVIAIGGIQLGDIDALIDAGAYGIAVSSAINNSDDIESEAKRFVRTIELKSTGAAVN